MAQSRDKRILVTLNTHSWQEADNASCLFHVAGAMKEIRPDIIALQEINQHIQAKTASPERLRESGYVPAGDEIGEDNWALLLSEKLPGYHWTWIFAHIGYRSWAEGIALLSRSPVLETRAADLSAPDIRLRRKALAVRTEAGWFCTVHLGWWGDERDPFIGQWEKLNRFARGLGGPCWLLGDFNNPAHLRGQGYDLILRDGWEDCYARAQTRDGGVTVPGQIDGWRETQVDGFRLDACFAGQAGKTLRSHVIFNGKTFPAVSDHYGVLTEEVLYTQPS